MSNVLIGIIGVILFIGLAVTGALYLGDRFKAAGADSRATATIAQVSQISAAIQMYELKTGAQFTAGTALSTLAPRFLSSIPVNPTSGPVPVAYTVDLAGTGGRVGLVLMELGSNAEPVCRSIARRNGLADVPTATSVATIPSGASGCFRTSVVIGSTRASAYYAFNRTWNPAVPASTPDQYADADVVSAETGPFNTYTTTTKAYVVSNCTNPSGSTCGGGGPLSTTRLVTLPITNGFVGYYDGDYDAYYVRIDTTSVTTVPAKSICTTWWRSIGYIDTTGRNERKTMAKEAVANVCGSVKGDF